MSLAELIGHIQSQLVKSGIATVLSGGTCVTMWSANAHRSDDIDLIPEGIGQRGRIRTAMLSLGFSEHNRYFSHPETDMLVEFPAGPPAVGEERPRNIITRETDMGAMRLLSPTDCIKDRLTWWFYSGDRQCLKQAALVAAAAPVDLRELRRWSQGEGKAQEFAKIAKAFKATR
jgi:hypothetical protein